jgi:hypothetical protein
MRAGDISLMAESARPPATASSQVEKMVQEMEARASTLSSGLVGQPTADGTDTGPARSRAASPKRWKSVDGRSTRRGGLADGEQRVGFRSDPRQRLRPRRRWGSSVGRVSLGAWVEGALGGAAASTSTAAVAARRSGPSSVETDTACSSSTRASAGSSSRGLTTRSPASLLRSGAQSLEPRHPTARRASPAYLATAATLDARAHRQNRGLPQAAPAPPLREACSQPERLPRDGRPTPPLQGAAEPDKRGQCACHATTPPHVLVQLRFSRCGGRRARRPSRRDGSRSEPAGRSPTDGPPRR